MMTRLSAPIVQNTQTDDEISQHNQQIACVDLFCGIGGLTHGLIRGGINVVAGVDIDPECKYAYETNNGASFHPEKVEDLSKDKVSGMFGTAKIRLLAGCAPCQPFSTYSRKGRKSRRDLKWSLVSHFSRLIREIQPELVTMENVPQLMDHEVFKDFMESLDGYHIWFNIVDCVEYGVPQTRKRLVTMASKFGPINLVEPGDQSKEIPSVRSAIGHLPTLKAGDADPNDAVHTSSALSQLNMKRIRASKPGGTWRDWDQALLAPCHRKQSGQTYPSVYGRMQWDAPAPTITTQCFGYGNGRFGHPEQNRAISLREAAILQTFPEEYTFLEPEEKVRFNKLGRLIGNAVPVRIGEIIAHSFIQHIQQILAETND